jgi:hypothetical protein
MFKFSGSALIAGSIFCALQSATGPPAFALDLQIELSNDTRMPIIEVYASPVGSEGWQNDLLGDDFLAPASSVVIVIDDGRGACRFDFKTVFDDGTTLIHRDVNLCAIPRYAISRR